MDRKLREALLNKAAGGKAARARARKKAKKLLARLKTYECWLSSIDRTETKVYGDDPRKFYDSIRAAIVRLARDGV
jgi:hypothetical protein